MHDTHTLDPVLAALPLSHGVHTATPAREYDPAAHGTHPHDPFSPVTADDVPAGHCTHTPAPAASLYVPGPHAAQAAPFDPVYPGRHEHCDTAYDPGAVVADCAGHVA